MKKYNVILLSAFVSLAICGNKPASAMSVPDKYTEYQELRQTQGESVATYDALLAAYNESERLINSIDSTSSQFHSCKARLLEMFPRLEDAVYFYAGRNNQPMTVKFAKAYVDLSLIYAFANDNITARENYPLITIFVATKLFNQKAYADALAYYRAYLSTSDTQHRKEAFENLTFSYYSLKNYNDAIFIASQALKLYPTDWTLVAAGLQAAGYAGDDAKLQHFLDIAFRIRPNDESLLLNQARLYQRQRNYKNAVGTYEKLYSTHPNDINVACGLAFNNYNAGVTIVRDARAMKNKKDGERAELEARRYFTAAAPILEDLLEANPYATNIARARAFCYSMLGDGGKLQQANTTLTAMKTATVQKGAVPVLETFFKPTTEVSHVEVAEAEPAFVSDIDVDVPVNSISRPNTYAIVFGNENYDSFSDVDYAANDATSFANYCNKVLGLPKDNIRIRKNATFSQMKEQINYLEKKAKMNPGELDFIIYYAGHGIPDVATNEAYLLPCDASGTDFEFCYQLSKLYAQLDGMNIRRATVFLDACFSGGTGKGDMLFKERYVYVKPKEAETKAKTIVFSAALGEQTAMQYADQHHGYFTYFLLKNLKATKGDITLADLAEKVTKEVSNMALDKNNKMQTPKLNTPSALGDKWKTMTLLK